MHNAPRLLLSVCSAYVHTRLIVVNARGDISEHAHDAPFRHMYADEKTRRMSTTEAVRDLSLLYNIFGGFQRQPARKKIYPKIHQLP